MIASLCDVAVFACGIALIAKKQWSETERKHIGIAMLALQAIGFLIFISVRISIAVRTMLITMGLSVNSIVAWLPWQRKSNRNTPHGAIVA